jgi:hypothetical protein
MAKSPRNRKEAIVDNDINLAAWMIDGGRLMADPTELRNRTHRRALAETQGEAHVPGMVSRLAASILAAIRPAPAPVEQSCCTA